MIVARIGDGYIHAGSTQMASTIRVEQTGPLQLTVRAGTFTWVDGTQYQLLADQVVNLTADVSLTKLYVGHLIRLADGTVDVFVRSRLDQDWPAFPDGSTYIHDLIWTIVLPPNTTNLTAIDIPVLTVAPGFPIQIQSDGSVVQTTEKDWYDVEVRGEGVLY